MRRFLRSRKALSPVIAAIILIAVTVAVSIAVAAWMGAITISFMGGAEGLKVTNVSFTTVTPEGDGTPTEVIKVDVMNVGSGPVTISDVKVDGTTYANKATYGTEGTDIATDPLTIAKGDSDTITVTVIWDNGVLYDITVVTATGNQFPYTARAPY